MTARAGIRPVVAVLAALLALAVPAAARAADVTVTTTADHNDKTCDAADCTLREAVELGTNTITLPKGRYTLALGELLLVNDQITGAGARASIIDGNKASRVFRTGDGTSRLTGVTVTGGNGASSTAGGQGGGIYVATGSTLQVSASRITGNTSTTTSAGIFVAGVLQVDTSEVSANTVNAVRGGSAGGIGSAGTMTIVNSTISGNTVTGTGSGGGIVSTGALGLNGVTIANNTAPTVGGLVENIAAGATVPPRLIFNTILSGNSGSECSGGGLDTDTTHNDLADDASCALADATDHQNVPAGLAALANNGGPTNTHALLPTSPAINQGNGCGATDQRGVARPQPPGSVCDIGAYEYRAPTLEIVSAVVNDDGGPLTPDQLQVHVRRGGADVKGSPAGGDPAGRTYTLDAGSAYTVDADAVDGYALSYAGDCAPTLREGDGRTCTVTADDGAATLHVATQVINDDGGTSTPGAFVVHVRSGVADVTGSPQPGTAAGSAYSLVAGTYSVAPATTSGYTFTVSGACAAGGSVAVDVGDDKTCTVTANDVAPTLKVVTTVVNDSGGTKTPAAFSVHVRKGAADVAGSPKPGTATGTTYKLKAGAYTVASDVVTGYVTAVGGSCAANGAVSLAVGQAKTCTVAANDKAVSKTLPAPQRGKNVNALPAQGTVKIKLPGTSKFVVLDEGEQIPLGTIVDVTKGRVTIVALPGSEATAVFYGGIFKLGQTKGSKPITVLSLVEKLSCKSSAKKAGIAKKKKKKRRLWGDGKGKFRTKGSFSSATVRGTKWLVQDTCTSTLTRVKRGKVAVRDFVKRKTVLVKAGHKYVARRRR